MNMNYFERINFIFNNYVVISNVYFGIVKIDGHNGSCKETNVG